MSAEEETATKDGGLAHRSAESSDSSSDDVETSNDSLEGAAVSAGSVNSSAVSGGDVVLHEKPVSSQPNEQDEAKHISVAAEVRMEPWGAVVKFVSNEESPGLASSVISDELEKDSTLFDDEQPSMILVPFSGTSESDTHHRESDAGFDYGEPTEEEELSSGSCWELEDDSTLFAFPLSPSSRDYSGSLETIHEDEIEDLEAAEKLAPEKMVLAKRALLGIALVVSSGFFAYYSHRLHFKWSRAAAYRRASERRKYSRPRRSAPAPAPVHPKMVKNSTSVVRTVSQRPKVNRNSSSFDENETPVHPQLGLNCRLPFAHVASLDCRKKAPFFDVYEVVSEMLI